MSKARDIASAAPAPSTVSATELGYVDGVTSAIQTQIDSKIGSASAINPTIVDAKGDIIAATAADTVARLAVGANGTVLTAASGQATGLEWATVSAGSNWTLLNSGGTALTAAATITVSGISGKDKIMVFLDAASSANASAYIKLRLNTDTGANYNYFGNVETFANTYSRLNGEGLNEVNDTAFAFGAMSGGTNPNVNGYALVQGCNSTGIKTVQVSGGGTPRDDYGHRLYNYGGYYNSASTITSISIFSTSGNFDNGTVYVYTSA